ncbi:MAG: hypothetical protein ACJASB_002442 [Shewanella psychromarinicola]|jgi:hypothetical protein|uniref:transposase n=1 Tax=Shewanella psychromarinicola TaxID=2487742 RepID=UPI003EE9BF16
MQAWYSKTLHCGRVRSYSFTDKAIETALMIKGLFKLSVHSLEGLIHSLFTLIDAPLTPPTYSSITINILTQFVF